MRQVSAEIARAFLEHRAKRVKNTHTDGEALYLHGNKIAWRTDGVIHFSLAGWNTVTTRERLNTLFALAGMPLSVFQRKHEPYVQDRRSELVHEISSRLPYAVTDFQ